MNDTKPCLHCKQPMHKSEFSAWNWKRAKTHRKCRQAWYNLQRRLAGKHDKCIRCGEIKSVLKFKTSKQSPKGYVQPCKACDCAKNRLGGQSLNTKHLDPYLTIPWTRVA